VGTPQPCANSQMPLCGVDRALGLPKASASSG